MLNLYFQHANGELELIGPVASKKEGHSAAMRDLEVRAPHFKVYYVRTWKDVNVWYWMDVGDWS